MEERRNAVQLGSTLALLWSPHSRPVGRTGRTIADFVAAAIALAQEQGVDGLSMRAIASKLGVRTMATYSFAPSKADLIALMIDYAYRDLYSAERRPPPDDWRLGLTATAEANRALHLAHPWLYELQPARSYMGPHEMLKHEYELAPLDGTGLTDVEIDEALAQVLVHVAQTARLETLARRERHESGLSDSDWWLEAMPVFERVINPARFPLSQRVGIAAAEARQGRFWGEETFRFGLERILDGIAALIERRR